MAKRGRPSKYKEEYAEQAYKLCLLGATDKELADFFHVNEDTINEWKKKYEDFSESLKKGKTIADATVAERLYQRAIGYVHPETKIISYEGMITDKIEVEKHYPPDPTAAIFWLKNRQRDKWRDKQEVEHTGEQTINNKVDFSHLTTEQIRELLRNED